MPGPYRHFPPNAYPPLVRRVLPAWQIPGPMGVVVYPEPPPPGERYLYDQRHVYCAGGSDNRGVDPAMYAAAKDRRRLQQMTWDPYAVSPMPLVPAGSMSMDPLMELDDEDLDLLDDDLDEDDVIDDLDDDFSSVMRNLGLTPEEVYAIESFGADEPGDAPVSRPRRRRSQRRIRKPSTERPTMSTRFQQGLQKASQVLDNASRKLSTAQGRLEQMQSEQEPMEARAPMLPFRQPPPPPAPKGLSTGAVVGVAAATLLLGAGLGYALGNRS